MWLQEVGSWDIVPDSVMKGTIDLVGPFRVGAVNHHAIFQPSHTVAVWWPSGKLDNSATWILQGVTEIQKPGHTKRAVLWTTNPHHKLTVETPLSVRAVTTETVLTVVHALWHAEKLGLTKKQAVKMLANPRAMLEDILNPSAPRYFESLKKADVYRFYGKVTS